MSKDVQSEIFKAYASAVSYQYPDDSLQMVYAETPVLQDLDFLRDNKKIRWDPSLKSLPFFDTDNEHPIRLVIYYRKDPVGYAFGGYRKSHKAVEVTWMEKRIDAHPDLDHQMLKLVVGAYATYATYLNNNGSEVDKLALVGPIEGVKQFYLDSGFVYNATYNGALAAMIADLVKR
ncbi:hypothetical protein [Serratia liquefaciens]|uniref:hypothetical protein n=1 Tax=Serratia liquefaciens TaxID=614 RepID=UPI001C2BF0C7|nr:hypothetical protein [Serratia liquefaciens]MBV0841535.1 hypothetical protein [Serratia liquefaciens]